jgi:hypothetical protein
MLKSQLGCAAGIIPGGSGVPSIPGIPGAGAGQNPADAVQQLGGLLGKKKKPQ